VIRRDSGAFRGLKFNLNTDMVDQVKRCFQGSIADYDSNMIDDDTEDACKESTVRKKVDDC
jgi:hypothetical protein